MDDVKKGLELLREPFPENQINKLPKGTKSQNQCPDSEKINCKLCGGWHHPRVIHLDYVGHAALTDRLLNADQLWSWEPLALHEGLPAFDKTGGLWIKLTVCGHTRLGYGHAESSSYKEIGSREKEVIGDAIRNAAMRFGAALDLWHKGNLHEPEGAPTADHKKAADELIKKLQETKTIPHKDAWKKKHADEINALDEENKQRVITSGVKHSEKLAVQFKEKKAAETTATIKEARDIFAGEGHKLGD